MTLKRKKTVKMTPTHHECMKSQEPVFMMEGNQKYYFWNETWTDCIGPFETKEQASKATKSYAKWLDTGEVDEILKVPFELDNIAQQ